MRKILERQAARLLKHEDSSERLAIAFAIGVFAALSPLVGLHTVLALAMAFLFGLSRWAVLLGTTINNPWTVIPYYALSNYLGGHLVGFPQGISFPEFGLKELFDARFWAQLSQQWRVLVPMAVGSTILALALAAISYPLALLAIRRGRASLKKRFTFCGEWRD
jgi:uncharacterized protein (DUF2062 family)